MIFLKMSKSEKRSLINLNTSLLPEYESFGRVNYDWNIEKHLNLNYNIDAAIAFSKLYFPTFIKYKNCIILENRFDEPIFNEWFNEFNGNIEQTERMCNLYELKDIFHINGSTQTEEKIEQLGRILKKSWELNAKELFPDRKLEVFLFREEGNDYITLNTINHHL